MMKLSVFTTTLVVVVVDRVNSFSYLDSLSRGNFVMYTPEGSKYVLGHTSYIHALALATANSSSPILPPPSLDEGITPYLNSLPRVDITTDSMGIPSFLDALPQNYKPHPDLSALKMTPAAPQSPVA